MIKQKICILGGLGYIGAELCRLYSGEARFNDITVIDNRFLAASVAQLSHWGIKFIHGDILDEALISEVLKDADIVYHLAGITDVAYTKTESNEVQDELIRKTGIEGTRNIIKHCTGKLIFPSTHVVFEGITGTEYKLTEQSPTSPVLTYAKGKMLSEEDIYKSNVDFIVLRLGSVYGYSPSDSMRINIMPNLFSKIASQNGTIKLYGGGKQWKSVVALQDVVRAMKYLAESDNTGTYHLSNENLTVKDVAEICKDINPHVRLVETYDEVPNLGYTLNNEKLLSTGFQFRYNIRDCIAEMIHRWSKSTPLNNEQLLSGSYAADDARGVIKNYELPEPINLIGYITSKKGTVRANHYHPQQEQKCLLISGSYISVTKDIARGRSIETRIVKAGDLAVIPANIAHTMVFLEDSVFMNLVNGDRDADKYGVTHTIPYELVNDELKRTLLTCYKTNCRVCGSELDSDSISLGMSPLANNLVNEGEDAKLYPLELKHCTQCANVQLSIVVPPAEMFDNYLYVSSTSAQFRKHFERAALGYFEEFNLSYKSLVVDIGSNDGVLLRPLQIMGVPCVGVEPAKNLVDQCTGLTVINAYFDNYTAGKIISHYGRADIVTANNVFAHADDIEGITAAAFRVLKPDGIFIVEVQDFNKTMRDGTFDNIYHEHVNYWTIGTLAGFFQRLGYCLYKHEEIDTHGGSLRVYVKRKAEIKPETFDAIMKDTISSRRANLNMFKWRLSQIKANVRNNFANLTGSIAIYGAPAKATTALNYFGLDGIKYAIEDNELKHGKSIPGVNIPIVSKEHALANPIDIVIVMAWNFFDGITANNQDLISKGVKFISIRDLYEMHDRQPNGYKNIFDKVLLNSRPRASS